MSDKHKQRSTSVTRTTYVRRPESNDTAESHNQHRTRSKTPKKNPWQARKRQLQQMDIEDLRQYVAETDEL
jgi:hypothetical protein